MSFRYEPVEGKPNAFRVFRDCDNGNQWHPDAMMKRYYNKNPLEPEERVR